MAHSTTSQKERREMEYRANLNVGEKEKFFFFFCAKRIHYCTHSPSLLLRILLLPLLPRIFSSQLLFASANSRLPWGEEERKLTSVKRGGKWKELDRGRRSRRRKKRESISFRSAIPNGRKEVSGEGGGNRRNETK